MTAPVLELAAHISQATDAAEKQFYGPSAFLTDVYERRRRIQQMTRDGMCARAIADVEGVTTRNVVRHRSMPTPPDNVIPLPPPPDAISDERAAELEVAADIVIDLAVRLQEENPLLTWDVLERMERRQLQELAVLCLATVNLDLPKSELFAWVLDLPAAKEEQP